MLYRYSQWDGTQQVFSPDADDLLEAISDDLLKEGDLWRALRRLMQDGMQNRHGERMDGLRQLMERLRQQRQQQLDRYDLGNLMKDIKERLEKVVQTERQGIQRRLDDSRSQAGQRDQPQQSPGGRQAGQRGQGQEQGQQGKAGQRGQPGQSGESGQAGQSGQPGQQGQEGGLDEGTLRDLLEKMAAQKQQFLDQLPPDPSGRIEKLWDYDFMDQEARRQFQELMAELQQKMLQNYFQGLSQGIQGMKPEDLDRVREMVRDLNRMLREQAQGGQPDFDEFMRKHGQFFGPNVQNLDDLVKELAQRTAQMQSLLDSMTPEMRRQLQEMMDSLLRDDRLRWDMAELASHLEQLYPMEELRQQYRFRGDEDLTFGDAMRLMEQLQQMDQLEQQLEAAERRGDPHQVDPGQVEAVIGPEARQTLEQMKQFVQMLEDAGYIQRRGNSYELTAHAIRKIGQKAMQEIFARLKQDRIGKHPADRAGVGGERTDDFKKYEFGDVFDLDIEKTLMNAVARQGPGSPVELHPEDFEVHRTELFTQSSTVLMLDVSRSMIMRGHFFIAKKMALALDTLIRTQFSRDNLYLLVFSDRAREIKPLQLAEMGWSYEMYGTNMQHAMQLARQLLSRHKGGTRQIIMVTDGEPTAHIEDGEVFFSYPPTHRTIQETLAETLRCTREEIVINTFMLERSYYLTAFIEQMTSINRGRAFYVTPERLGDYVLVDYVNQKRKRVH